MQGIIIILMVMSKSLISVFSLSGSDTLDYFFTVFNGGTTHGTEAGAADAGVFGQAYKLFLICAFSIIFLNMLYQIFKAFFGPLVQAESPSRVVIKSIFFGVLVGLSQNIVAAVFEIAQIPFDAIYNDSLENSGFFTNFFSWDDSIDGVESVLATVANASALDPSFWETVISIVLFFMLIKNFMVMTLEMTERYLMLGLLTIIAPLCIACGAVKGVEEVFKNWLSWLFNGCIVLIFTTFFLSVFIANFSSSCDIPYLLLWICWFKAGQKIDEHMNALGLKTAKTGGFGFDVMNAMQSGLPIAMGLTNRALGTNVPTSLRDVASGNWQPKGGFLGMSNTDRRVGDMGTGMTGAFNKMMKKATNGKATDALQKASTSMSKGLNLAKEKAGLSSGFGKNTGLSHEELQKYANGEKSLNNLSKKDYQNVAKDLIDMKAGKQISDAIKDNNMNISSLSFNKDGNMSFKATDDKGNAMACMTLDRPTDPKNMLQVEGADGETRGCLMKTDENPDAPLNMPFEGFNDEENNDKQNVMGASDDTMSFAGSVADGNVAANPNDENLTDEQREFIEASEGQIPVSSENINDDNSLKKFDENGNEDPNGHFIKADDGTENGMLIPESAIQDENPSTSDTANIAEGSSNANGDLASDFNQIAASTNEQIDADNVKETIGPDNTKTTSLTDGSGTEFTLSQNADGTYTGTSDSGDTATFTDNGDGSFTKTSEAKEFDQSKGISSETSSENISADNIVSGANGAPSQATDANGVSYNLQDNGDGTFTGINAAGQKATFSQNADGSLTKDETRSYATGTNGEKFEVASSSMHDSVKDTAGVSQNIDMSKDISRNENGTISATNEDGSSVTLPASSATTMCTDSATKQSFEMDNDKGFRASIGNNGQLQVSAANAETGNYQNISGASVSINGNNMDLSKSIQSHEDANGNVTYSGQDMSGNRVSFSGEDLEKSHITAGNTSLHTTRSADVMSSSGRTENTMNFRNENSFSQRNSDAPVIVKSADGEYFKAQDSQRYDAEGRPSRSGAYMKTTNSDGVSSFVEVEQSHGNIRSYNFGANSNKMTFAQMNNDGKGFTSIPEQDMNYSHTYREPKINETPTHYNCGGVNYEMWDNESYSTTQYTNGDRKDTTTTKMPQHYVDIGGSKYPVDMERATFSQEGRVVADSNGNIPVRDYSSATVNVSQCTRDSEQSNQASDYVKYKDPVNGAANYFNTKRQNVSPTIQDDSYYNDVRSGMNLNQGTSQQIFDSENLPTGKYLYKNEGEEYILHPQGSNVSSCKNFGSWVTMPNGKTYFAEPSASNYMNRQLYKMGYDLNNQRYSDASLDTKSSDYKLLADQYHIPRNASNVTLTSNESGACIKYSHGGKQYAVTNLQADGFNAEEVINVKGRNTPVGYKYQIKNNASAPLSKLKNRLGNSRVGSSIQRNNKKLQQNRKNNYF